MPYGHYTYGSYGTTPYVGSGYGYELSSSPAFQWGYAAASQFAQRMPRRRRRALSAEPVTASAGGVTVQYASKGGSSSEFPVYYPRSRRAAIDDQRGQRIERNFGKMLQVAGVKKKLEVYEDEEPLVAPVS